MHIMQQPIINSPAKVYNRLFIKFHSVSQNLLRVGYFRSNKSMCLLFINLFFNNVKLIKKTFKIKKISLTIITVLKIYSQV